MRDRGAVPCPRSALLKVLISPPGVSERGLCPSFVLTHSFYRTLFIWSRCTSLIRTKRWTRTIMFSPPPSPLPPRHPPLAESSSDGNDGTEEKLPAPTAEETTFQSASEGKASRLTGTIIPPRSSSPLPSFPYIRRHLLVFMIPLILFIVGSTSSFIVGHEERGNFDNTPVWRETISGSLRDPSFLPVVVAPVRHTLGQLSRHLHKARLYGGGKARSPTFPAAEPRDDDAHSGNNGIPAARQATPPTGTVANAVQETPPSIPTPAWPVPTPCKLLSFSRSCCCRPIDYSSVEFSGSLYLFATIKIVPQPFDSSISYNFTTSSCLAFFTTQLANNTFRECRPFGLLFGTSSDFFSVQSNLTELTAVLGGTCNTVPSEDTCVGIMDWMASQMLLPSVCRDDLAQQNVVALEAIYGTFGHISSCRSPYE